MNEAWKNLLVWQLEGEGGNFAARDFTLSSHFYDGHLYTCVLDWVTGTGKDMKLHSVSHVSPYMEIAIGMALEQARKAHERA